MAEMLLVDKAICHNATREKTAKTICKKRSFAFEKGIKSPFSSVLKAKSEPCERTVLNVKKKYDKELPRMLYTYFTSSVTELSIPSFSKFARSIGVTLDILTEYRKHKEFDRAWRDCIEIRRDYLTDCALTKRYDPSFVKFLLGLELGTDTDENEDNTLAVTVKVES